MPNTLRALEMLTGLAVNPAVVDMLRKREAARADKALACRLLEAEMMAAVTAKLEGR